MIDNALKEDLLKILREDEIKYDEPMKNHTTFKIGGNADIFIDTDKKKLPCVMKCIKEHSIPYFILGNGSDLLVSDKGIRGAVINMKSIDSVVVDVDKESLIVDSGISLNKVSSYAKNASLSGMEYFSGIPGTVGGAIYMNAGAYGSEMKDIVESVTYLDSDFNEKTIEKEKLDFSYRHSFFSEHPSYIILHANIKLQKKDYDKISSLQKELEDRRKEKQPLNVASAGSTFKRPKDHFAGKLIQEAGLLGYSVGDAKVSEKHAGFCVNTGSATFSDMIKLIEHIISEVEKKSGVKLEPEVKIIGE